MKALIGGEECSAITRYHGKGQSSTHQPSSHPQLPRLAKPRYLWISAKRRGGSAKAPVWTSKASSLAPIAACWANKPDKVGQAPVVRHNWNLLHVLGLLVRLCFFLVEWIRDPARYALSRFTWVPTLKSYGPRPRQYFPGEKI